MTAAPATSAESARAVATEVKRRWRRGEPADTAAALRVHPELAGHRSIVIDLAYEEFLAMERVGTAPAEVDAFVARFPAFRDSIRDMLDAHRLLTERPELLDPAANAWPEVGSDFEGLELLEELGRGAFGRAYLCFDPETGRACVLKLAAGRSTEARVIGSLSHPHVTNVYWARTVGWWTAVCMPFVGTSTLADVIAAAFPCPGAAPADAGLLIRAVDTHGAVVAVEQPPAAVTRLGEAYVVGACAIAARIAEAVGYLHSKGVAHGDLKPSNVVMGPGGFPHLIDFNLSAFAGQTRGARGTPGYMAPELFDVSPSLAPTFEDGAVRADLFSLGTVIIELLTGRVPVQTGPAEAFEARTAAVRAGPPELPESLPSAVAGVLCACLSPDPMRRPRSAGEVAAALDRFVAARRKSGRRALLVLCLGSLVTGVAAMAANHFASGPSEPAPATADELFDRGYQSLRTGNAPSALAHFMASYEQSRAPRALAFAAYSMALNGQAAPSAEAAITATRDGFGAAEVYNNIGYALCQAGKPAAAIPYLDKALQLSKGMQAALYNRALARYRAALAGSGGADPLAVLDMTEALSSGPTSPDLHFDAARIFAAGSELDPALAPLAIEQVRASILAGKDPVACREDPSLRGRFGNRPAYQAACDTPRGTVPARPVQLRLLEPPR